MSVDVVIPATRPCEDLIWSLGRGSLVPDDIIVVSNEMRPYGATVVTFDSAHHPTGWGDAGLRRDIGADVSRADIVIFLDDDCIASRSLVEKAVEIVDKDGFCWGHHRYIGFHSVSVEELLDLPPEEGRSREDGVNRWHGWQSSYAGLLAIDRRLFWEVGGFDLGFLGHHGNEDGQLGRRLASRGSKSGWQTFVHEPPFAWHPTVDLYHSSPKANFEGSHRMATITVNGHEFSSCEKCPCRKPLDVVRLTMSDEVVIPYDRQEFEIEKERI